jgi:hypothetical protein
MTTADLARSAQTDDSPPAGITSAQKALWLVKAGRWHDSHELCNDIPGTAGSWIHAYLHREEGDLGNASYGITVPKKISPRRTSPSKTNGLKSPLLFPDEQT